MQAFEYTNSPYPIRRDLTEAYRHAWRMLAHPGTWWSGEQRVSIAQEVRNAAACDLCRARKAALSPFLPQEEPQEAPEQAQHNSTTSLPEQAVDITHRLTTDASRLTGNWLQAQFNDDFTAGHYVEIVSVVVTTMSIDSFNLALGFEPEPLPAPSPGAPTQYQPSGLETKTAWVPLIGELSPNDCDLWEAGKTANVIRALSLVPDAVRLLKTLSAAQYVQQHEVPNPSSNGGRAISRAQIEFIAARVSALNDCFY